MLVTEVYTFSLSKIWKNLKMQVMYPGRPGSVMSIEGVGSVGKVGNRTPNIMRSHALSCMPAKFGVKYIHQYEILLFNCSGKLKERRKMEKLCGGPEMSGRK